MKNTGLTLALGLAAALITGCASTENAPVFPDTGTNAGVTVNRPLSPELLQPPKDVFVLGPGDQVDVEIIGTPGSHTTLTVGLDGKVYYSLLPGTDVMGLTLAEARARLESELAKNILHARLAMSLRAVGSKHVWIVGRMNRPGIYPLSGPMTLLEALSLAGGTATSPTAGTVDLADLRHSFVMRGGQVLPVNFVQLLKEGDMSQNIYLLPDDFVFIPSTLSQEVYVLGAVNTPRTVPYAYPMSVVSAITGASGAAPEAYLSHVAIVRGSLSQPELITVDYKAIIKGNAPNVALEPGDIVYVPLSPYRYVTEYANLIVNTFAGTWTANMGIRAVQGSGSVGVAVPVGGH